MYHIADDTRARRSAQKLVEALEHCLDKRRYEEISVSELCAAAGVGRATFYRLFDNLTDVLYYQCCQVLQLITDAVERHGVESLRQATLDFFNAWMKHRKLLETLQATNQLGLLHKAHLGSIASFRTIIATVGQMGKTQEDYVLAVLTTSLPTMIRVWTVRGKKETAEELYSLMKSSAAMIGKLL